MSKGNLLILSVCTLLAGCSEGRQEEQKVVDKIMVSYPEVQRGDQVDEYFGTSVADPYRWLEDDRSEETERWVKAQNKVTFQYLAQIPFRGSLKKRLTELWNYEKFSAPFKEGENYYYFKNDGLQNQSVLYKQKTLDGASEVFLDPNTLKEDGTAALGSYSFSKDGDYFAYAINDAGSDWQTIYIKEVESGKKLKEELKWAKFTGMAWNKDGFYYSKYDEPEEGSEFSNTNEYHKVYFHKLNTPQSEDKLVFWQEGHPKRYMFGETSEDEQFLFVNVQEGTHGVVLHMKDLKNNGKFIQLNKSFDNDHYFVHSDGNSIYLYTNYNAPNYKLVRFNAQDYLRGEISGAEDWEDFVLEHEAEVLESVKFVGGKIYAIYMQDAHHVVYEINEDGTRGSKIELPTVGSVGGFNGKKGDKETYFVFTSYTYPSAIYKLNIESGEVELYRKPDVQFNPEDFVTEQVFYMSEDGTKVSMFITHKKGLKMDGSNPTYLYGYGGFNISLNPRFKITMLPWLENGGVYVVANLRGGGEYGEKWHEAGMLLNKQNVFNDFIAAAEHLIKEGYTSKEKLAIAGGSNGGLLVGACMTQRPDLFQVALPAVGVMDMLRYHKFTVGWGWAVEYGSSDDSTHFQNLIQFSPLHNIQEGTQYPATLVTTADHDDRVVPAHSFKFISELQSKHSGDNPVLIRVDVNAGHGAGKPTEKIIEEWTDILGFTMYNLGETYPEQLPN